MISLALVTSAGELSAAAASVSDNLEKNIREGNMDIEDKKAWAAGLGICEVLFRGEDLQRIYALKAAKRMVAGLTNSCVDTDSIVNAWIDSPEVHIRENNGYDNVIDFICDKAPKYPLASIEDKDNAKPEVDQYLSTARPEDKVVSARIFELSERVHDELHALMLREVNKDCGVGTCKAILQGIRAQIDIFMGEMNEELEAERALEPRQQNAVDLATQDLQEYNGKFFKMKTTLSDKENYLLEAVNALAVTQREQVRRLSAITFYNGLIGRLAEESDRIEQTLGTLEACIALYDKELSELTNCVTRPCQTFQIDLAQRYATQINVDDKDVLPQDFIRQLQGRKVYDFGTTAPEDVAKQITDYCMKMTGAIGWGEQSIDDVVETLSEADFAHLVNDAIARSATLLRIDTKGHMPAEQPSDFYYIGVPDKMTSRLRRDDFFKSRLTGTVNVDFASLGMRDRIIIFRQIGVIPAYAVASVPTYEEKYLQANCCLPLRRTYARTHEARGLQPQASSGPRRHARAVGQRLHLRPHQARGRQVPLQERAGGRHPRRLLDGDARVS